MTTEECIEQTQEDIRTCMDGMWNMDEKHLIEDMLCQIVVDNFKKLKAEDDLIITQGDKKLKEMLED